jgi:hypothetical protein
MEDPIVINKEEITYVNPQLSSEITSPEQKGELDSSFKSFFNELDEKEAAAPAPTGPEAERKEHTEPTPEPETHEAKPSRKRSKKLDRDIPPIEDAEPTYEEPTGEADPLDALSPHPQASQKTQGDFRTLRELTKKYRNKSAAWETNLKPILAELVGYDVPEDPTELTAALQQAAATIQQLKTSALTPQLEGELNELRSIARSVGILRDAEFTREFVQPVDAAYRDVIQEMAQYFDAPQEKIKADFLDPLLTKFNASMLPPEWYDEQLNAMTKAPQSIKAKIQAKIANVLNLQERHDAKAREFAENPQSFAAHQQQQQENYVKEFRAAVEDEVINKCLNGDRKDLGERWLPKPLDGVTNPAQRAAIEKRNEYFHKQLDPQFRKLMADFSGGPRAQARRAIEFLELKDTFREYGDPKELSKEVEQLKKELGHKRKVGDSVLRGGNAGTSKPSSTPLPKSGSKSLQRAFDSWQP